MDHLITMRRYPDFAARASRPGSRCQTRSGVAGISTCRTPNSDSASTTALMHGAERRRRAAFAAGADAVAVARSPAPRLSSLVEGRQIVGARHGVIHERAGQHLPALAVVMALLQQRLADALRRARHGSGRAGSSD